MTNDKTDASLFDFFALCLVCGLCLAFRPTLEREANLDLQKRLLVSIFEEGGELVIPAEASISIVEANDMDYYIEDIAADLENGLSLSEANEELESDDNVIVIRTGILSIPKIDLALPVIDGVRAAELN